MAMIASSPWIFPANTSSSTTPIIQLPKNGRRTGKDLRIRASSAEAEPSGSGNPNLEAPDKVKLALLRAKEYKNKKSAASADPTAQESVKPAAEAVEPAAERSGDFQENRDAIAEAISRRDFGGVQSPPKTGKAVK